MLAEFSSLVRAETMVCEVVMPRQDGFVVVSKFRRYSLGHPAPIGVGHPYNR